MANKSQHSHSGRRIAETPEVVAPYNFFKDLKQYKINGRGNLFLTDVPVFGNGFATHYSNGDKAVVQFTPAVSDDAWVSRDGMASWAVAESHADRIVTYDLSKDHPALPFVLDYLAETGMVDEALRARVLA